MLAILFCWLFGIVGVFLLLIFLCSVPELFDGLKDFLFSLISQLGIAAAIGIGIIAGIALIIFLVCRFLIFADDSCHEDKRYDEYHESINNILSKFN